MSKEQCVAFFKKVGEYENLKQKLTSLSGDNQAVYAQIAEIALAEGYDVVPQDFKDAFSGDGPLDDAAVAQVAGGCCEGDPNSKVYDVFANNGSSVLDRVLRGDHLA